MLENIPISRSTHEHQHNLSIELISSSHVFIPHGSGASKENVWTMGHPLSTEVGATGPLATLLALKPVALEFNTEPARAPIHRT